MLERVVRFTIPFAALVVLAVLATGCGDGRSAATTPVAAGILPLPGDLDRLDPVAADFIRATHAELAADPASSERWLRMAMAFDANEYDDPAAEAYAATLALDGTLVRAWYHQFRLQSRLGRVDAALASVARVIELRTDYAPAHWRLGQLLLDLGRFEDAEASFRRALVLDGNEPAAWIGLARALVGLDRFGEAAAVIEDRRAGAGLNAGYANLILANAYRRMGRTDDATAALEKAGDAKPVWRDTWDEMLQEFRHGYGARIAEARALLDAGRLDDAISALEAIKSERPDNVTVLANLGQAYRQKGRIEDSLAILRRRLEIDPNHFPSHFHLAVGLIHASRRPGASNADTLREAAVTHLDRSLALNPTYAPGHSLRGDIHLIDGETGEALARFREAARCDPDDGRFPYRIGITLIQFSRWEEAIEPLERAVTLAPENIEAWRALAVARMNLGRYDEAEVALREGLLRSPGNPRVNSTLDELQRRRSGTTP